MNPVGPHGISVPGSGLWGVGKPQDLEGHPSAFRQSTAYGGGTGGG